MYLFIVAKRITGYQINYSFNDGRSIFPVPKSMCFEVAEVCHSHIKIPFSSRETVEMQTVLFEIESHIC